MSKRCSPTMTELHRVLFMVESGIPLRSARGIAPHDDWRERMAEVE